MIMVVKPVENGKLHCLYLADSVDRFVYLPFKILGIPEVWRFKAMYDSGFVEIK